MFKWLPFSPVFDLVEEIGEGTFSTVYLAARRGGGGARVALKHLVPTSKPSRIAMEVECMEKGKQKYTIKIYYLSIGNTYCIVLCCVSDPAGVFFRRSGSVHYQTNEI